MKFRHFAAACSLSVLAISAQAQKQRTLDFYFVDVEGGAATLIVSPAGESFLIDCGSPGKRDAARIAAAARVAGVKAIDYSIATHWHSDHFGGTPDLVKAIPVKHFLHRGLPAGPIDEVKTKPDMYPNYLAVVKGKEKALSAGDKLPVKQSPGTARLSLTTVCSNKGFTADQPGAAPNPIAAEHLPQDPDPSDNARSLGIVLRFGKFSFMNLGDLTWNMEYRLVAPTNKIGKIEVYQSTHHGLDISNNPIVIKSVQPHVAVFNNGPHKGGHPEVVRTLRDVGTVEAIYQMHKNLDAADNENTEAANIANLTDPCKGDWIKLSVQPDGKSYTVQVGAKGQPRRFITK